MSEINNTATGKVGRLPFELRQVINYMMRDGATASEMNAFLVSKKVKDAPFNGTNFTNWRKGGHQKWLKEQARYECIRERSEAIRRELAAGGFDTLDAAALEIAEKLTDAEIDPAKAAMAVSALKAAVNGSDRVRVAEKRASLAEQSLNLQQKKFQRDTCELFLKWHEDKQATEIAASTGINASEKLEMLGKLMFKEDW